MRPFLSAGDLVEGRFEVRAAIAGGGSSWVHRAVDRVTGDEVAIKVLSDQRSDFRDRFEREVTILSRLSHPAIVRYIAHGDLPVGPIAVPYLVTEWVAGETLAQRLSSPGLTMSDSVALVRELAGALAVVHAHDLVHRDVKPANIVFSEFGGTSPKLIDFGIARSTMAPRSITGTGIMVGTPGFVSPEQARGSLTVGPPSDVFSLGCVFYLCLTGLAPFSATSAALSFMKIVSRAPPPVRDLVAEAPAALELLLSHMLAKDALRRPANGAELVARIERLGEIPDTPLRSTSNPSRPVREGGQATEQQATDWEDQLRTVVSGRSAVLAIGGGMEPLTEEELEQLGALAGAVVDDSEVIVLPEEVILVRATHVQLDALVTRLRDLAMSCIREFGERVMAIAEEVESEWAIEAVQQESLTRLFAHAPAPSLLLVHDRLKGS